MTFATYSKALNKRQVLWSFSVPKNTIGEVNPNDNIEELRQKAKVVADANYDFKSVSVFISKAEQFFPGYEMTSCEPLIFSNPEKIFHDKFERVALLGDAAHKITTQAGLGATAAFQDAMDLAELLITKQDFKQLREYEKRMFKRARLVTSVSLGNTRRLHQIHGPIATMLSNWSLWVLGKVARVFFFIRSFFM